MRTGTASTYRIGTRDRVSSSANSESQPGFGSGVRTDMRPHSLLCAVARIGPAHEYHTETLETAFQILPGAVAQVVQVTDLETVEQLRCPSLRAD